MKGHGTRDLLIIRYILYLIYSNYYIIFDSKPFFHNLREFAHTMFHRTLAGPRCKKHFAALLVGNVDSHGISGKNNFDRNII